MINPAHPMRRRPGVRYTVPTTYWDGDDDAFYVARPEPCSERVPGGAYEVRGMDDGEVMSYHRTLVEATQAMRALNKEDQR